MTEDEAVFFFDELAASVCDAKGEELHELFGGESELKSSVAATRRSVKELVLAHEREQLRHLHEGQGPGLIHDEKGSDTGSSVDLTGELLDRRYRLIRVIRTGELGHLYEGLHVALGRRVAVNVLFPQYASDRRLRERFLQEARAASRVRHPNVVEINDYGETSSGFAYVVMEALDGNDVRTELQSRGTLSWARTRSILLQAASALYAAHIRRVIHRDIKPEYCFVTQAADGTEHVKLFGFGGVRIGCYEHVDTQGTALTGSGEVFGTVGYMAPEQALGAALDARSDIYSLGIMAYEMLVGHVPFAGANAIHVITRHLNDAPVPLRSLDSTIPVEVEELVLRMIAKEPSERYVSMKALEAAIGQIPPGEARKSRVTAREDGPDATGTSSTGFTLVNTPRRVPSRPVGGSVPMGKPTIGPSPSRPPGPIGSIVFPATAAPRAELVSGMSPPDGRSVAHRQSMPGMQVAAAVATIPGLPKRAEAGITIGGYELVRRIGRGGMAEVWVAWKALGRRGSKFVAIKLIADHYVGDERYARMFRAEAELAAVLSHANIVQVFDEGEENGRSYLIMEWVDGLNLLKLGAVLSLLDDEERRFRVIAYIIGQLLHALHYAHNITSFDGSPLGVVHRDVSPQNVLVSNHGEVKLTDFGVAYYNFEESSGIHVKGKVRYMSPEQLAGRTRSPTVDLYAVGALLHELLDGKKFRGEVEDGQELFTTVLSGLISPLSRPAPPELERMRLALLEPDPERRLQTAEDAMAMLKLYPGYGDARDELTKLCRSLTGVVRPRVGPAQSSRGEAAELRTARWSGRRRPPAVPKVDTPAGRGASPTPSRMTSTLVRAGTAIASKALALAPGRSKAQANAALITGHTEFVRPQSPASLDDQLASANDPAILATSAPAPALRSTHEWISGQRPDRAVMSRRTSAIARPRVLPTDSSPMSNPPRPVVERSFHPVPPFMGGPPSHPIPAPMAVQSSRPSAMAAHSLGGMESIAHLMTSGVQDTEVLKVSMLADVGSGTEQEILPSLGYGEGSETSRVLPRMSRGSSTVSIVLPRRSAVAAIGVGVALVAAMALNVTWLLLPRGTEAEAVTGTDQRVSVAEEPLSGVGEAGSRAPSVTKSGEPMRVKVARVGTPVEVERAKEAAGNPQEVGPDAGEAEGDEAKVDEREPQPTMRPVRKSAGEDKKPRPTKPLSKVPVSVGGTGAFNTAQVKIGRQVGDMGATLRVPMGRRSLAWRKTSQEPWRSSGSYSFEKNREVLIFVTSSGLKLRATG